MPLPDSPARREIHHRVIDMHVYSREDGLYDVEGRVVDSKPFDFLRPSSPKAIPAGASLHDISVRLTLDSDYEVREVAASSDTTPWAICKEAEATLGTLVGQRIAKGWSAIVKERLRGTASCTHLMEMLIPIATAALQGIRPMKPGVHELAPQIDTCYAFSRDREVVQTLWHKLHGPAITR